MTAAIVPFDQDPPAEGRAVEIEDGVLWMRLPLPMALDHVNVYAFHDPDGWTLIDSGLATARIRAIWQDLLDGPLGGHPVARVLVTHHHPDHVGLAGEFQRRGAELMATRTAWLFARMLTLDVQKVPPPETLAFWRGAGVTGEALEARARERPFNFADAVAPMPLGFRRIAEGDRLRIGGRLWQVGTGGGHAPEHATLWQEDGDLVIGGDQLLPSISPNLGVYATEPEADPVADWLESCALFREEAQDRHLVLPGHGRPYTGLPTRLRQLIENHEGALRRLEAFLAEPRVAIDCFQVLFRREVGASEFGLALVEAMAHCLHLWHAGRATRRRREDGAWLWQSVEAARD